MSFYGHFSRERYRLALDSLHLHQSSIARADFGQMQIVFAVDVRFGGAIRRSNRYDRRHVLEVGVVVDFDFAHSSVSVADFENHRQLSSHRLKRNILLS